MSSTNSTKKSAVRFDDYALFSIVFFLVVFLATDRLRLSLALVVFGNLSIFLFSSGRAFDLSLRVRPYLVAAKVKLWRFITRAGEVKPNQLYDTFLGYEESSGKPIVYNLQRLQSILIASATGFGKTTIIQEVIDYFIRTHEPDDLRLILCDSKRVSTSPWRHIPHLLLPIAVTQDEHALALRYVIAEMKKRQGLFSAYEDAFCESLNDYIALSGNHLPRVVIVIDELMESIKPGSDAYSDLTLIANKARFVGITLILGTQRPSANVITGELLNSLVTKIFGFTPNTREYSLVNMIPPEIYGQATATPGRFMLYVVGQWIMMSVKRTDRVKMARRAKRKASQYQHRREFAVPDWEELRGRRDDAVTSTLADRTEWRGSMDDKVAMLRAWSEALGQVPRVKDIVDRYGITKPTAIDARKRAFPEEYR